MCFMTEKGLQTNYIVSSNCLTKYNVEEEKKHQKKLHVRLGLSIAKINIGGSK